MQYQGSELELFALATHWKSYFAKQLIPHIAGDVLEVGAGLGGTTPHLLSPAVVSWCCLEPDPALADRIRSSISAGDLPEYCRVLCGTTKSVEGQYDTVLYMDVLEHIREDAAELHEAARICRPGGKLIVLGPAHNWLFSPFDAAVGHHRRYSLPQLRQLCPRGFTVKTGRYLDSVGLAASGANKLFLRQSQPTTGQIKLWDNLMVPLSRRLDPLLGYRFGKSVLAVFENSNSVRM